MLCVYLNRDFQFSSSYFSSVVRIIELMIRMSFYAGWFGLGTLALNLRTLILDNFSWFSKNDNLFRISSYLRKTSTVEHPEIYEGRGEFFHHQTTTKIYEKFEWSPKIVFFFFFFFSPRTLKHTRTEVLLTSRAGAPLVP